MTVDRFSDRELELGPPTGTNVIQFHVIFLEIVANRSALTQAYLT